MPAIYEWPHTVCPGEIDAQGHANNVEYLKWMQDAALAHSAAQGWPAERYLQIGGGWVARRHTIDYDRPAFEGEAILVRTWVAGFRKVTSVRRYEIVRRESDEETVIVRGETTWAFVDLQSHRPRRIPDDVASAFEIVSH